MRKIILTLTAIFMCAIAHAATETINWYMDGNTYATTQCETGSDIILPQTPYKYGYTFQGWDGYIPIEYLESTGTQWINTGYKYNENVKIIFKANWTRFVGLLFGANSGGGEQMLGTNAGYLMGTRYTFSPAIQASTDNIIEFQTYKGDAHIKINNVLVTSNQSTSSNSYYVYLFKTIEDAGGTSISYKYMKLYYFKLYDKNGNLRLSLIPTIDSNGTPCMFDKVEQKFYYNQGTGDFIAGPIINE